MDFNRKINIKIYIRAIVAILLIITWTLVGLSGLILWLAPEGQRSGRVPLLFDLTKSGWGEVHLWLAIITLAITIIHVIIDWKTLRAVIRYMVSVNKNNLIN